MHVTACLAGQKEEDVEVGEDCRSLQTLKACIVAALPQLYVEGFDVSVGGRALDDEGVVSLEDSMRLDVSVNARGLSALALRELGHEVSEAGLLEAASGNGFLTLCALYLDAGVPIDCVNGIGSTPLHHSCRDGDVSVAKLFLDRGSRAIDGTNVHGNTPLHISCIGGNFSIAKLLLDRGSSVIDKKNDGGSTPLELSCRRGHVSIATLLLDCGSRAIDGKDWYGSTPLHHACKEGHVSIAALLLDRGSRAIDEQDRRGRTPLFYACCEGFGDVATLLLDRGCDFDVEQYHTSRPDCPREVSKLVAAHVGKM